MTSPRRIVVDKTPVPFPQDYVGKRTRAKYPWADLKVKGSFKVPIEDGEAVEKVDLRVKSSAYHYARKVPGFEITTRLERGVLVVWRVA